MKNQFRSLDEDEIEFLDSVLESTRAKEAEVNKQTREELDAFRRQQEEAEKAADQQDDGQAEVTESWTAGPRKRKKGRESTIGGVKIRRTSTVEKQAETAVIGNGVADDPGTASPRAKDETKGMTATGDTNSVAALESAKADTAMKPPSPTAVGLGLAAYSSEEDD